MVLPIIMEGLIFALVVLCFQSNYIQLVTGNEVCVGPSSPTDVLNILIGPESGYSNLDRPNLALLQSQNASNPSLAKPDNVRLNMKVISVTGLDLRKHEFESTIEFTESWNDYRLSFSPAGSASCLSPTKPIVISETDSRKIWKPEVILRNGIEPPELLSTAFWVFGNGTVLHTQTYISRSACELDLSRFPYDTQTCKMLYGSWKADIEDVKLRYDSEESIKIAHYDDVFPTSEEFKVLGGGVTAYPNTANDSQIVFFVTLERESQYYFQFVIIPVVLMCIVSWSSFFVDRGAAPARVTLSIISFLTISNFISNQFIALPKLPSKVWLLRFMETSLFYAFIPVVEYVACNYLFRVERRIEKIRKHLFDKKLLELERARLDAEQGGVGCKKSSYLDSYRNADVYVNKKDMVAYGICKIDRLLLKRNGLLFFKDQHLDIFFRWVYPITYVITLGCLVGLIGIKKE